MFIKVFRLPVVFLLIGYVCAFSGCTGRMLQDYKSSCRSLSIITFTSNSWFGWGDDDPDMADGIKCMAYDMISISIDQIYSNNARPEEVNESFKNGRLVPGRIAAENGISELHLQFTSAGINHKVLKTGKDTVNRSNLPEITLSSQLMSALSAAVPEKYASVINNINEYIQNSDPWGHASPDEMPVIFVKESGDFTLDKKISAETPGSYRMIVSAVYTKNGMTVFGTGSADITCVLSAYIVNDESKPVWKTVIEKKGSSFAAVKYFPVSWKSVEESAAAATSEALKQLSQELKEDFPHIMN